MLSEVQSDWSQDYFDDRYHNFKSTIFSSGNVHVYRLYLHLRVGEAVLIFLNAATPILLQKNNADCTNEHRFFKLFVR